MRAALLVFVFVAVTVLSPSARAESTNCGQGRLVETGDRIEAVLDRCGTPSWHTTTIVHNRRNPTITTRLDEWVYDLGEGWFLRYLRFYDGVLETVEERSREGF
jgi:hypothetical protein